MLKHEETMRLFLRIHHQAITITETWGGKRRLFQVAT